MIGNKFLFLNSLLFSIFIRLKTKKLHKSTSSKGHFLQILQSKTICKSDCKEATEGDAIDKCGRLCTEFHAQWPVSHV